MEARFSKEVELILASLFKKISEQIAPTTSCTFRFEESVLAWEYIFTQLSSCKNMYSFFRLEERVFDAIENWLDKCVFGVYSDVTRRLLGIYSLCLYIHNQILDKIAGTNDPSLMAKAEEDVLGLLTSTLTNDVVATMQVRILNHLQSLTISPWSLASQPSSRSSASSTSESNAPTPISRTFGLIS